MYPCFVSLPDIFLIQSWLECLPVDWNWRWGSYCTGWSESAQELQNVGVSNFEVPYDSAVVIWASLTELHTNGSGLCHVYVYVCGHLSFILNYRLCICVLFLFLIYFLISLDWTAYQCLFYFPDKPPTPSMHMLGFEACTWFVSTYDWFPPYPSCSPYQKWWTTLTERAPN